MQDYAFDIVRVRGLGRSPAPPPILPSSSPPPSPEPVQGLGQEPEGLGQGKPSFPTGIELVNPQPHCRRWALAFVNGAKRANVLIHDGASFDYQHVMNILSQHTREQFFTFAGTEGTYLFAYEIVNGKRVFKLCVDKLTLHHTPQSSAHWTASVHPTTGVGLGAVFKAEPAPAPDGAMSMSGGGVQINPINRAVGGTWAPIANIDAGGTVTPNDPTGQMSIASDLPSTLNNWAPNIVSAGASAPKFGGFFYFGLSDSSGGAAQTPGEPPGMAIMRFNGHRLDMLIKETGGGVPGSVPGMPTWIAPLYAYISGGGLHTPPVGPPPGVSMTAGSWVWRPNAIVPGVGAASFWMWYPTAGAPVFLPTPTPPPSPTGMVPGGMSPTGMPAVPIAPVAPGTPSGIWVYANAAAATPSGPNQLPPPTSPPVAGAVGQWTVKHNGYYVWIGSGAPAPTAPATTSSTGLILLGVLGVLAVGGVGYYLLS